jgi:glycosyltransferase involved in cell wall biosynthesis
MLTVKARADVQDRIDEALGQATGDYEFIFISNPDGGVAENRNACLRQAKGSHIIFIDDDLYGYPIGWNDILVEILNDPNILMVGPRLINADGTVQNTISKTDDVISEYIPVGYIAGACMAYRKNDMIFNEEYKGWGMEDVEFELELKNNNPNGKILLCNLVKLIHKNEMKNESIYGAKNKIKFIKKWGFIVE